MDFSVDRVIDVAHRAVTKNKFADPRMRSPEPFVVGRTSVGHGCPAERGPTRVVEVIADERTLVVAQVESTDEDVLFAGQISQREAVFDLGGRDDCVEITNATAFRGTRPGVCRVVTLARGAVSHGAPGAGFTGVRRDRTIVA